jgi:hypothetical protein
MKKSRNFYESLFDPIQGEKEGNEKEGKKINKIFRADEMVGLEEVAEKIEEGWRKNQNTQKDESISTRRIEEGQKS